MPHLLCKGTIKPSILFTDTLESKIDYLVNKLGIKKFKLHIHPYVAAYVNQGIVSLKRQWQLKYGFGIKIIPSQKLALLQYEFYDTNGGRNRHEGRSGNEIRKTILRNKTLTRMRLHGVCGCILVFYPSSFRQRQRPTVSTMF